MCQRGWDYRSSFVGAFRVVIEILIVIKGPLRFRFAQRFEAGPDSFGETDHGHPGSDLEPVEALAALRDPDVGVELAKWCLPRIQPFPPFEA